MIDNVVLIIVIFILISLYVWRQIVFDRSSREQRQTFDEREKDLINRLMSRDAIEYANVHQMTRYTPAVTVADAVDKLTQEGIDAEELFGASGDESTDRVRVGS